MNAVRKRLTVGASLIALAAALPIAATHWMASTVSQELASKGWSAGAVSVSLAGTVEVDDLRYQGSYAMQIGKVTYRTAMGAWISGAEAQSSGYSFTNVTGQMGPTKIEAAKIDVVGASVGKDDIARIFVLDAGLPERLKSVSAKSVSVPEIRLSFEIPGATENFGYVFKNITADNIVSGKVGRWVTDSASFTAKMKEGTQTGEILKTVVNDFDMVQMARVYFDTAKPGEKPAPLYSSYVFDGMRNRVAGAAAIEMEIGKVTASEIRMRPLEKSSLAVTFVEMMKAAEAQKNAPAGNKMPEKAAEMFAMVSDLLGSIEDEGFVVDGMKFFVGEKAKPVVAVTIAKLDGSYGGGKKQGGFRLTGLDVKAPDVTAKLASYSIEGFSYMPMFKGMADAARAGDIDFKRTDPRTFIPQLGTTILTGLEIDAPDPKSPPGTKPGRISVKLGKLMISLTDQLKGIPTNIDFTIDKLAVKLPENSADNGIKQLKALGYSDVDMSGRIAAKWNEATKAVSISEVSLGGVNMGKVRLTGDIGNIGREVFEGDLSMAQVALMGATAKALSLQVDNGGLGEKLLAMEARKQGRKPEDLRKELGQMAQLGIPAVLGPSDDAKAIANAVARFATSLKSLTLNVKSKNAGGVGIPDIVTIGTPDKALGLVSVQATAN